MNRLVVALVLALGAAAPAAAQPAINDGTGVEINPDRPKREAAPPADDRRPIYVAGGIAFLAALFLWNRRRRAELERDEDAFMRRSRARTRAARDRERDAAAIADDPDAADLRRAASGDQEPMP